MWKTPYADIRKAEVQAMRTYRTWSRIVLIAVALALAVSLLALAGGCGKST